MESSAEPVAEVPSNVPDRLRWLRRMAGSAWIFGSLSASLLWMEFLARILLPWSWTFVLLTFVTVISTLLCTLLGLWRIVVGPSRLRAMRLTAIGLMPAVLVAGVIVAGAAQYRRSQIAPSIPFITFVMAGTSLGEIEAPWRYANRMESDRIVMVYDARIKDPKGDLDVMEKHVANLERVTRQTLREKILWVRGSLLGQRSLSVGRIALGSDRSPASALDRHELAHAVLFQLMQPTTAPSMLLTEGWAESRSNDPVSLAERALYERRSIRGMARISDANLDRELKGWLDEVGYRRLVARAKQIAPMELSFLRELTDPYWYFRDKGSVYNIGGAFVDFLVRTHGGERFVDLYLDARPGSFDESVRLIYGKTLSEVEAEFWRDCERITRRGADAR